MKTFADIEKRYASFPNAKVLLQPIPYDRTSTWGKGADNGFRAFLEASHNMELYDIETNSCVYKEGIHILPSIVDEETPDKMFNSIYKSVQYQLGLERFLTFFGGEHSISIGIIKAFSEQYPNLTVLQLDAHADLRPHYLGSKYNHACAMHEASKNTNLIQVGIRSLDASELKYINRGKCFYAQDIVDNDEWMDKAIKQMGDNVYLSIDLDVFDPSIMPSTGTPEPGGLLWYPTLKFLKKVFSERKVLGFDMVELAPNINDKAPDFLTAKLYYKLLSYKFKYNDK
ncbi:agmatinase [Carboxylicivirga sp. RSCT41]|uniref:agmatinase n=1 Tax=Carboxylicivirga agarovorans TaxID=3417570 RepID=UPI003D35631A